MTLQKSSKVMPNFLPKSLVCAVVLALSLRKLFHSSAVDSLTVAVPFLSSTVLVEATSFSDALFRYVPALPLSSNSWAVASPREELPTALDFDSHLVCPWGRTSRKWPVKLADQHRSFAFCEVSVGRAPTELPLSLHGS